MSFAPGEIIVKFKDGVDGSKVLSELGLRVKRSRLVGPNFVLFNVEVPAGTELDWIKKLSERDDTDGVELNSLLRPG